MFDVSESKRFRDYNEVLWFGSFLGFYRKGGTAKQTGSNVASLKGKFKKNWRWRQVYVEMRAGR